jgi:hypothetical protein
MYIAIGLYTSMWGSMRRHTHHCSPPPIEPASVLLNPPRWCPTHLAVIEPTSLSLNPPHWCPTHLTSVEPGWCPSQVPNASRCRGIRFVVVESSSSLWNLGLVILVVAVLGHTHPVDVLYGLFIGYMCRCWAIHVVDGP